MQTTNSQARGMHTRSDDNNSDDDSSDDNSSDEASICNDLIIQGARTMINNKVSNRHNWLIYLTKYLKQAGLEAIHLALGIHLAVMEKNLEFLKLLITQGAKIDCTNNVNDYL